MVFFTSDFFSSSIKALDAFKALKTLLGKKLFFLFSNFFSLNKLLPIILESLKLALNNTILIFFLKNI